jgi:hypothetical protein
VREKQRERIDGYVGAGWECWGRKSGKRNGKIERGEGRRE